MLRQGQKRMQRWLVMLLTLLMLGGCGATFTYRHLDWLAFWYLDDYVDFTTAQKEQVKTHIQQLMNWHWHHQLPHYQRQLDALSKQVASGPMTAKQWQQWMDIGQQDWQKIRSRLAGHLVVLAPLFSTDQIDTLFARLEDKNQHALERHQRGTASQQKQRRYQQLLASMQDWTGQLNPSQRQQLKQWLSDTPSTFSLWIKNRREWQKQLHQCLLAMDKPGFAGQFLGFFQPPQKHATDQSISVAQQNRIRYARLLAKLDRSLTHYQRQHLLREIRTWQDDVAELLADGPPVENE